MSQVIAILTGGISAERDIALASAASVERAIADRAQVVVFDVPTQLDDFIARRKDFSAVIPVFHGRYGEDGAIQGFLETLNVPYIFSRVGAHALAIDKAKTNLVMATLGINVLHNVMAQPGTKQQWTHTVVVKPNDSGSSIGISIAHNQAELDESMRSVFTTSNQALIEDYVAGKEFSVAVIDVEGKTEVLPVISIESQHEFFDFESKYVPGLAVEKCPADIPDELSKKLQAMAVTIHKTIGARHVSRSDFIVDESGKIWFLEVNTIPGMSVLLPKAIAASGRDFGEVLMGWVEEVVKSAST